jgi:hypothetical protein
VAVPWQLFALFDKHSLATSKTFRLPVFFVDRFKRG